MTMRTATESRAWASYRAPTAMSCGSNLLNTYCQPTPPRMRRARAMPRELVLQKWCEVCADEDATVPATVTYSGAIAEQEPEGNMQVRLVDLCERHAKVAADFAEFWSRFAVAPMASQTVPRPGPKP